MWDSAGMSVGSGTGEEGVLAPFARQMFQRGKGEPRRSRAEHVARLSLPRCPANQLHVKLTLYEIYPLAIGSLFCLCL